MFTVILDATENEQPYYNKLQALLEEKGNNVVGFRLKENRILVCRGCGSCSYKSPGKCVFNDDMHKVLRALAKCDTIIMLTPIRFGGYPSHLKKAVDKFALLALPSYTVRDGHLVHPPRYGHKTLIGIGISEGISSAQEASFRQLVEHNALNIQSRYRTFILNTSGNIDNVIEEITNELPEVCLSEGK